MLERVQLRNNWVFNARLDLLCFVAPFLVSFYIDGSKYIAVDDHWMTFFLAKIFIGGGHIFATYLPIVVNREIQTRLDKRFYIFPVIFFGSYIAMNFIGPRWFMNFLAITGLYHIYVQHYSWLRMSQKDMIAQRKKMERIFFLVQIGIPNFLWLLRQLDNKPSYLYPITITNFVPNLGIFGETFFMIFTAISLLGGLCLSVNYIKGKYLVDIGRLVLFSANTVWMCYGLFYSKPMGFFHTYLALSHGASYMAYIALSWPSHQSNGEWNSNFRFLKVSLVAIALGSLWVWSYRFEKYLPQTFMFLMWTPLIVHYAFDSIIWRKSGVNPGAQIVEKMVA